MQITQEKQAKTAKEEKKPLITEEQIFEYWQQLQEPAPINWGQLVVSLLMLAWGCVAWMLLIGVL